MSPLVVYESESGEGIDHDTQVVIRYLDFVSQRVKLWWDPAGRILRGEPLRGWSTNMIGVVNRHLISMGIKPRS
jgi:hypothetical protein